VDPLRQLQVREPAIALQLGQDRRVDRIKLHDAASISHKSSTFSLLTT
jgi:hypothetical protein